MTRFAAVALVCLVLFGCHAKPEPTTSPTAIVGETPKAKAPDDAKSHFNSGTKKLDEGDKLGAILDYDEAIRQDPKEPMFYINRGVAKAALGDRLGAIADYDTAIRLDRQEPSAYYNRGNAKLARGDRAGAIADFDESIRLDPSNAEAHYNKACAFAKAKDGPKAASCLKKAIAISLSMREDAKKDPDFDPVRNHPDFQALMK
ncbi:MAG: tetratricopeptide repeat protein [Fimbriimonadaceae bacterium]